MTRSDDTNDSNACSSDDSNDSSSDDSNDSSDTSSNDSNDSSRKCTWPVRAHGPCMHMARACMIFCFCGGSSRAGVHMARACTWPVHARSPHRGFDPCAPVPCAPVRRACPVQQWSGSSSNDSNDSNDSSDSSSNDSNDSRGNDSSDSSSNDSSDRSNSIAFRGRQRVTRVRRHMVMARADCCHGPVCAGTWSWPVRSPSGLPPRKRLRRWHLLFDCCCSNGSSGSSSSNGCSSIDGCSSSDGCSGSSGSSSCSSSAATAAGVAAAAAAAASATILLCSIFKIAYNFC